MSNGYFVFTSGHGEYGHDWAVSFYPGASPEDALKRACSPSEGYGKEDGFAVVVHEDDVHTFALSPRHELVPVPHPSRTELLKA